MLADLKLRRAYDGLLYFAESTRNLQKLQGHHHIELELNLVVQGTITYVVNGRRFTFSQRTLLWLFPQQEHQMVDRSDNAQFYVAVFKPSVINRYRRSSAYKGLRYEPGELDGVLSTVLKPDSFDLIRKTMDVLMQGSMDSDLLNREAGFGPGSDFRFEHSDPEALNAGLRYLLLLCWRSQLAGTATRDAVALHPAVRRALKILSEGNAEQNLEQLARECGASQAYLSRRFHREIGVPLNRYRNSLRLSRFFEQYQPADGKTMTEAVYAAGFGSYAQFHKVFSQAYGRGPRESLRSR